MIRSKLETRVLDRAGFKNYGFCCISTYATHIEPFSMYIHIQYKISIDIGSFIRILFHTIYIDLTSKKEISFLNTKSTSSN
jgi:hypothetical protein